MDDKTLAEMLAKACPRPSYLAASHGGPALALALHCLMVNEGFMLVTETGRVAEGEARFVPHKDWNGMYMDQWVFEYRKPGKANRFILHCSLQARTKRMFIHASEENNSPNVAVLGLQLENYMPNPTVLKSNSWVPREPVASPSTSPAPEAAAPASEANARAGTPEEAAWAHGTLAAAVVNAAKMRDLLCEHVVRKVLEDAEDLAGPPGHGEVEGGPQGDHQGQGPQQGQGAQQGQGQGQEAQQGNAAGNVQAALAWIQAPVSGPGVERQPPYGRVSTLLMGGAALAVIVAAAVAVAVANRQLALRPRGGGA